MQMEGRQPSKRRRRLAAAAYGAALVLLLASAGFLLFGNLESAWVEMYDELRHAVNAYEMVVNGDYLVNTYFGETDYFNLKPPLSMWAIALSFKLFGFTLAAIRLPSALASLLMLAIGALWLKKNHGSVASLAFAGSLAAINVLIAGHYSRNGDPDALYQLFFTASMLLMFSSDHDFRWFYGSALCFALAFMTKSWHALCIPAICLLYLACTGRIRELTWKRALLLLAAGFAPVLPWAIARYMRDGMAFLSGTVSVDITARMLSADTEGPLAYFRYLLTDLRFMAGAALCAAAYACFKCAGEKRRLPAKTRSHAIGCLLWMLVPPILFSFSGFKKFWYIFSSYTALCMLMGLMLQALWSGCPHGRARLWRGLLTGLAAALCLMGIGADCITIATAENPHHYQVAMMETLTREDYAGTHMYIQYNEMDEAGEALTDWADEDRFIAELYGGAVCLPGGRAAFEEDMDGALLLLGNLNQLDVYDELSGYCIPLYETRYITIFSN
ncbi:MAG: glycosyltransferase family 39 protein [Clostridiales bacterium]|nr:glycosyltransferase family 39 protein [Clostridiales bacterium]MDO4351045.1 glycosyltransferase family 39 protein [Eubacteriales bacterium]MDY4007599.1 glycosyltransferase family 39 protein [Candidatus Limiplasma sp.]